MLSRAGFKTDGCHCRLVRRCNNPLKNTARQAGSGTTSNVLHRFWNRRESHQPALNCCKPDFAGQALSRALKKRNAGRRRYFGRAAKNWSRRLAAIREIGQKSDPSGQRRRAQGQRQGMLGARNEPGRRRRFGGPLGGAFWRIEFSHADHHEPIDWPVAKALAQTSRPPAVSSLRVARGLARAIACRMTILRAA